MGVLGFEPRTSSLSGTRSNQLSYTPGFPQKLTLLSATGLGIPLRGSRQFSGAPRSGIPLASQCSYLRFDAALGHGPRHPASRVPAIFGVPALRHSACSAMLVPALRRCSRPRASASRFAGPVNFRGPRAPVFRLLRNARTCASTLLSAIVWHPAPEEVLEPKGLEPSTSCLQSRCSSQLSYGPSKTIIFSSARGVSSAFPIEH